LIERISQGNNFKLLMLLEGKFLALRSAFSISLMNRNYDKMLQENSAGLQ
jgi:hypothetical protein